MSSSKKIVTISLVFNLLFLSVPMAAFAQTTSCPPGQQPAATGTGCIPVPITTTTIAPASTAAPQNFTPNANISGGNTYNGASISGVGGAIASCLNVGSFLIGAASSLLSQTNLGKTIGAAFNFTGGSSDAVSTSDKPTQDRLDTANRTTQCLDGVAYAVAKNALAQLTNKTLNWVNTGLNGNPLYVQNVQSYLGTINTQQTNLFLNTVQGSDPIFGNALRSAITFQITGNGGALASLNTALNTPQAQSYNSFQSDFTNGGWNALLDPSYNPVGAFFNAVDTLNSNISTQQQQASSEIQRNNGFLDMKQCVKYADATPTTTSGSLTTQLTTSTQKTNGYVPAPVCVQWTTTTPGSVISSQVQTITNTPVQQLVYANKINEVLGGFFDSFVTSLIHKGLSGSGTNSTKLTDQGYGSEGNNFVSNTVSTSSGADIGYQASNSGGVAVGDFDISRPQQLYRIIQSQYDFLNRVQDSRVSLERIIPTIGALDYCIPGPNPDYGTGLSDNWQTFESSIQQASINPTSTPEKIIGSLPIVGGFLGEITSLFTGSGKPPTIWTGTGPMQDKITGEQLTVERLFYTPAGHSDGIQTSDVLTSLTNAYQVVVNYYNSYQYPAPDNSFDTTPVGVAFAAAHPNDPSIANFLQNAYVQTDSLVGYNKTVSTIEQIYQKSISDTQNNLTQLEDIRQQVNTIVAAAKDRYIRQNPGVNVQCLDAAYVINNMKITGAARQEPNNSAMSIEESAIVKHSMQSGADFYNQIK